MSDGDDLRLIAALEHTAVERDPATLTRALARVRNEGELPAWVRWFARPAAMWTAAGLVCASAALSAWVLTTVPATRGAASQTSGDVIATLLGEDGTYGIVPRGADSTGGVQ